MINIITSNGILDITQIRSIIKALIYASVAFVISGLGVIYICLDESIPVIEAIGAIVALSLCMGIITYAIVVSVLGAGLPMVYRVGCATVLMMVGLLTAAIACNKSLTVLSFEWRAFLAVVGIALEIQVGLSLIYDFIVYYISADELDRIKLKIKKRIRAK